MAAVVVLGVTIVVPAASFSLTELDRGGSINVVHDGQAALGLNVATSVTTGSRHRLVDVTNRLATDDVTVTVTLPHAASGTLYVGGQDHGSVAQFQLDAGEIRTVEIRANAPAGPLLFDVTASAPGLAVTIPDRHVLVVGGGVGDQCDVTHDDLRIDIAGEVTPGTAVTLTVTNDGSPVVGQDVKINRQIVGQTDANGQISVTVPDEDEFEIEIETDTEKGKVKCDLEDDEEGEEEDEEDEEDEEGDEEDEEGDEEDDEDDEEDEDEEDDEDDEEDDEDDEEDEDEEDDEDEDDDN